MAPESPLSTIASEELSLYSRPAVRSQNRSSQLYRELLSREEAKLIKGVFLNSQSGARRAVVFSGIERGNGCTTVCARAAENLASRGEASVCIVDANLRFPALHEYFGANNLCGLAEMLLQSGPARQFAQRLPGGLYLLTSGFHDFPPDSLLSTDRLRLRMNELCSEFDYILIDTPPLNEYGDAISFGQLADGIILVLEANVTRREKAQESKAALESAQVKVLGAVLNKRTYPIPEAVYRRL